MKGKLLIGVLVVALAAALIGGVTMAWFTDSDDAGTATFTAGTLKIDIDNFEEHAEHIKLENLNPGDYWDYSFDVVNVGTKRLIFTGLLCYKDTTGQEREVIPTGEKYADYGTGKLSDVLETVFVVDGQQDLGYGKDGVFYEGTLVGYDNEKHPLGGYPKGLEEFKNPPIVFGEAQLNPGERLTYHVKVDFPGDKAGNEYQGSQLEAAFTVLAKQIAEGAEYPAFECPFGEGETAGIKDFTISNWSPGKFFKPLKCYIDITDVKDVHGKFNGKKDVTMIIKQKTDIRGNAVDKKPITVTGIFEFSEGIKEEAVFFLKDQLDVGGYEITVIIDDIERTIKGSIGGEANIGDIIIGEIK